MEMGAACFVQGTMEAAAEGLQELVSGVSHVKSSKACAVDGHLVRIAVDCPQCQWSVVAHRRTAVVAS